jgi:hypothetical protein
VVGQSGEQHFKSKLPVVSMVLVWHLKNIQEVTLNDGTLEYGKAELPLGFLKMATVVVLEQSALQYYLTEMLELAQ